MLFEPYFSCCLFIALHQICYLHYRNTAYFIFPFFHELEKTQNFYVKNQLFKDHMTSVAEFYILCKNNG